MEETEPVAESGKIYQKLQQIESILVNLNDAIAKIRYAGPATEVVIEEDPKKKELEKKLLEEAHRAKELEQEKYILSDMNVELSSKTEELEGTKKSLESKLKDIFHRANEAEQSQMMLEETVQIERAKEARNKKIYITIALVGVIVAASASTYLSYAKTWELESKLAQGQFPGKFVIQNLKGDTVNTWIAWHMAQGDPMHVNIINTAGVGQDRVDAVISTILSKNTRQLDDALFKEGQTGVSTYYDGWAAAMQASSALKPTQFYIPIKIDVIPADQGAGGITIELVKDKSPDGYAGFTKSITDQNQILKAQIVIYSADTITIDQLTTVTRHEVGHALGLAHSSAPEDLMAPIVTTKYPYIGECDLAAMNGLYDGGKKSEVTCER